MTTPEQIDNGGSVTADLISERYVAGLGTIQEKVKSVGGLSLRDYFAAAALQGHCANPDFGSISGKSLARAAYEISDLMLAARKEGA
jgi:hypothetical protein